MRPIRDGLNFVRGRVPGASGKSLHPRRQDVCGSTSRLEPDVEHRQLALVEAISSCQVHRPGQEFGCTNRYASEDQHHPAVRQPDGPHCRRCGCKGVLLDEPQRIPDSSRWARSIAAGVDWLATAHGGRDQRRPRDLFTSQALRVHTETSEAVTVTSGMTVADLRPSPTAAANVEVCRDVKSDEVLDYYEEVING
jgi:hypothetical protein